MRLFVAINLPIAIAEYIGTLQQQFLSDGLRLTHEFHLTLRFLGQADREIVHKRLEGLRFRSFQCELSQIGGTRHVIWLSIKAEQGLYDLQRDVRHLLRGIGEEDDRRFTAHVTLARLKHFRGKISSIFVEPLFVEPLSWSVKEFFLIKSELSPEGSHYFILHSYLAHS